MVQSKPSTFCLRTSPGSAHVEHALRILLVACAFSAQVEASAQQAPVAAVEVPLRVIPIEILINGISGGLWPVLERGGSYFAPDEAFDNWRLQRPTGPGNGLEYRGLRYALLSSLPQAQVQLDPALNVLNLTLPASAFAGTRMARQAETAASIDPVVPSLFLNYDISADNAKPRDGTASNSLGLTGEAGYSTKWGLLTSSFVGRDLVGTQSQERHFARLNTTYRKDFLGQRLTLSAGDSATRTGYLGRPSYFGGLQLGTNFGLNPSFNRNPIPVVSGETRTPSTVQLYINNVLRQTTNVPSGPFTLDTLPAVTGRGDVSVVVRDILGRETIITQPFFVTSDLLGPGISDWSAELGKLRANLGSESNNYGATFATGFWRYGLNNTLTLEGRIERTSELSTVGAAAVASLGGRYVGRMGLSASSDAQLGDGQRWLAGLDWQDRDRSFYVAAEANTRNYLGLGDLRTATPIRLQLTGQAGLQLGAYGRLGASFVTQQPYDGERVTLLSLSHNIELPNRWQLATNLSKAFGGATTGYNLNVSLNIPLGKLTSAALSSQIRPHRFDVNATVVQASETAYGTSWRVQGSHQDTFRAEAGAYYFGPHGILSGDIAASSAQVNYRVGASGSLLYAEGKLAALQRYDTSAVLVEVPGYAGVGVGLGGQSSVTTDSRGMALLTGLSAYRPNPVQLVANDLPVTAEIDNIERVTTPPARSVTRVTFQVRGGRAAILRILLEDGDPAPVGAIVRIEGEETDFYVSRRGEAYVTGLKNEANSLRLTWKGKACPITLQLAPGAVDDIVRAGPVVCKEVVR